MRLRIFLETCLGETKMASETWSFELVSAKQLQFALSALSFLLILGLFILFFLFFLLFLLILTLTISLFGTLSIITVILLRLGFGGLISGDLIVSFFALLFFLFLFLLARISRETYSASKTGQQLTCSSQVKEMKS